jgi:hypothetical protein
MDTIINWDAIFTSVPILLFAFLGILQCIKKNENMNLIKYLFSSLTIYAILFLVYGINQHISRLNTFYIFADFSLIRYMLPIFILMVPFFVKFLTNLEHTKILALSVVLVLIVYSISVNSLLLDKTLQAYSGYQKINDNILKNTVNNSVIFLNFYDKYLLSDRSVCIVGTNINYSVNKFVNIVTKLHSKNIKSYIMSDSNMTGFINDVNATEKITLVPTKNQKLYEAVPVYSDTLINFKKMYIDKQ